MNPTLKAWAMSWAKARAEMAFQRWARSGYADSAAYADWQEARDRWAKLRAA